MTKTRKPTFFELFGRSPAVTASAPGCVNLIGEHTDYKAGLVMPIAIPQQTHVEIAPRIDGLVQAYSAEMSNGHPLLQYVLAQELPRRSWLDYVQGLTYALRREGLPIGGFDLRITSDVPAGSGLSSSAALEIAVLRGLRVLFSMAVDDLTLARLGQRAEIEFVGAPAGIMDQMAAALADETTALFLDTRSLDYERLPLPAGAELAVIDSGFRHDHAKGGYRERRAECDAAATMLGVAELRDLPEDAEPWRTLPSPLDRRVRHIVTENARVHAAREAIRASALDALGRLLVASHDSMRDDFEVSVPLVDRLVAAALEQPHVLGARLTGGGFGGCLIALAERGHARRAAEAVVGGALDRHDGSPSVVLPQ